MKLAIPKSPLVPHGAQEAIRTLNALLALELIIEIDGKEYKGIIEIQGDTAIIRVKI
jgi:hypothetical protein